jgi:hypothetical protein
VFVASFSALAAVVAAVRRLPGVAVPRPLITKAAS